MGSKPISYSARALQFPFYLWIVSVYPILHLYTENFGLVRDHQVAQTIAAMLIATTIAFSASGFVARNSHKRAFFLAIASLTFSTSGHFYSLFIMPRSLLVWSIASVIVVTAIAIACIRFTPQHSYAHFTAPFNLIAGALLTVQIVTLFAAWVSAQQFVSANLLFSQISRGGGGAQKRCWIHANAPISTTSSQTGIRAMSGI